MSRKKSTPVPVAPKKLLTRYGVTFPGDMEAIFEEHLKFSKQSAAAVIRLAVAQYLGIDPPDARHGGYRHGKKAEGAE